jgi:hypothetical protein
MVDLAEEKVEQRVKTVFDCLLARSIALTAFLDAGKLQVGG